MKYGRIVDDIVQDVIYFSPDGNFTSAVAETFISVPDDVVSGSKRNIDGTFSNPVAPDRIEDEPVAAKPVRLTKLAFRNRFTPAEKAAIEFASIDDPSAPMAMRLAAAGLRADLADQRDARYIEITLDSTIAGVNKLAQFGLISPDRPAEILSTTALPHELWSE